jgi:Flp pilus assembly protein TadG
MLRGRKRDERGVTIVEAAFVIPVFFVLIFGLIDMGLWTLQKGQASSAARDGARAGIVLHIRGVAGSPTSSANVTAINNAVASKLDSSQIKAVTITCVSGTTGSTIPCSTVVNGRDRLKVEVQWQRPFLTFIGSIFGGNSQTITGTTTMVIAGAPT